MVDWFLLAELHVLQAMAQARAMGYPALSTAREKARRFACALQWTTPLSSLLPAPPRATTYESLDRQRQLCLHVNELTGMSQIKMYVAAQKRWLLCTLCQRRWMQVEDRWVVNDREHPEATARARMATLVTQRPPPSQPCSAASPPSSAARTATRSGHWEARHGDSSWRSHAAPAPASTSSASSRTRPRPPPVPHDPRFSDQRTARAVARAPVALGRPEQTSDDEEFEWEELDSHPPDYQVPEYQEQAGQPEDAENENMSEDY